MCWRASVISQDRDLTGAGQARPDRPVSGVTGRCRGFPPSVSVALLAFLVTLAPAEIDVQFSFRKVNQLTAPRDLERDGRAAGAWTADRRGPAPSWAVSAGTRLQARPPCAVDVAGRAGARRRRSGGDPGRCRQRARRAADSDVGRLIASA